jgi:hypothetical protein
MHKFSSDQYNEMHSYLLSKGLTQFQSEEITEMNFYTEFDKVVFHILGLTITVTKENVVVEE